MQSLAEFQETNLPTLKMILKLLNLVCDRFEKGGFKTELTRLEEAWKQINLVQIALST